MPIDTDSVIHTTEFLIKLPDGIDDPDFACEPSGRLSLIWRKNGYHLVFVVLHKTEKQGRRIGWAGTTPNGKVHGEAEFGATIPEEVTDLLRLVLRRR